MAAPEPESSAADLPVPETGMDFDLFGPSAESPSAQPSVQPTPQAAPTAGWKSDSYASSAYVRC